MTITLTPELTAHITAQAAAQGTTPELFVLDRLQALFAPPPPPVLPPPSPKATETGATMADLFADPIGTLHSAEIVPGSANLSENTGRKFKELMLRKYRGDEH